MRRTASFDVFCVKIGANVLAVDDLMNPKKRNYTVSQKNVSPLNCL